MAEINGGDPITTEPGIILQEPPLAKASATYKVVLEDDDLMDQKTGSKKLGKL